MLFPDYLLTVLSKVTIATMVGESVPGPANPVRNPGNFPGTAGFETPRTVNSVDTIEIEAAVIDAARRFGRHVERVFSDSRSAIFIDDARSFLSTHNSRYDIIAAEPRIPGSAGCPASSRPSSTSSWTATSPRAEC